MTQYKKQIIPICSGFLIEIHHNPILENNPYHIRFHDYDGCTNHRIDKKGLLKLSEAIHNFALDNANTIIYNDE